MKIVVVGDAGTSPQYFAEKARTLPYEDAEVVALEWKMPIEELQKHLLNIEVNGPEAEEPPEALMKEIVDADILLVHVCPVPRKVIAAGKKLRMIGVCRGGLDNIDVGAATERAIPVFHVVRNAEPVADFTLGLIYAETRNIARSHQAVMGGDWVKKFPNSANITTLQNQTVGLVGLGHIGKLVAQRLLALGVCVIGCDPFMTEEALTSLDSRIGIRQSVEEIFREADIISLHLRLSEQTKNLVGRELLSIMKPSAYLINTSRAGILEESAFIDTMQRHAIAGAALDVFWQEPIPPGHAVLELDNVTITPHIAGDTVDAIPKSPKLLVRVIREYMETGKSDFLVNKAIID